MELLLVSGYTLTMRAPTRIKPVMTVISSAAWPNIAGDRLAYWLSRPPSERVEAARDFCRTSFLRLHRPWPTRISKTFRPFLPEI